MADGSEVSHSLIPLKRQLESDMETETETEAFSIDSKDEPMALNILVQPPTSPDSMNQDDDPSKPILPTGSSRQPSPALSSVSSLTSISSTTLTTFGLDGTAHSKESSTTQAATAQPSNKRRKLTPAEKQQRQEEKDRKEKERAEQKAKREEQKQVKDEERRQKEEVKEAKRREKELEKERKEQEKQRVEEEKERKERAQSRINAFFAKPFLPSGHYNQDEQLDESASSANDAAGAKAESDGKDSEATKSDYRRTFLPFALPSNTCIAPINRFSWDDNAQRHVEENIDKSLHSDVEVSLKQSLDLPAPCSTPRRKRHSSVRDIIKQISFSDSENMRGNNLPKRTPLEELQSVPMRYIHFTQDVRPPYIGTYTKLAPKYLSNARRNPFIKVRPDTDYNYDSEAEWEEPEDGEDLLSEGESELDSCDETDEMDDFLDDQDADKQTQKRKVIATDLEPVCSGLCLENAKGESLNAEGEKSEFRHYKMGLLQEIIRFPIDPFCSSYWPESEKENKKAKTTSSNELLTNRPPLQARPNFFANIQTQKSTPTDEKSIKQEKKKTKSDSCRLLEGQQLADFKAAVVGSEHGKIGLLAIVKKQFPKVPNKVLQDTLVAFAERKGRCEAEKRWVLKET